MNRESEPMRREHSWSYRMVRSGVFSLAILMAAHTANGQSRNVTYDLEVGIDPPQTLLIVPSQQWVHSYDFEGCGLQGWLPGVRGRLFTHPTDDNNCAENTSCAWIFTDAMRNACTPSTAYGPQGTILPSLSDDEILSPWVFGLNCPGPDECATVPAILSFDVFPGNVFTQGRQVLNWAVRARIGATMTPWQHVDDWRSLSSSSWTHCTVDMTPYLAGLPAMLATGVEVQVRFRVSDWQLPNLGGSTPGTSCPGPGPYIDNVVMRSNVLVGPSISPGIDTRSQAQDCFPTLQNAIEPGEHFSPTVSIFGSCAFSQGGDIGINGTSQQLIPGDSIHVFVQDVRNAGGVTDVRFYGAITSGPHSGKAPAPLAIGGNGFFSIVPDVCLDANGDPIAGAFFVDLDDTYFRGGDVLEYFWLAVDNSSGYTSLPIGMTSPPPTIEAAREATGGLYECSFLPTINWAPSYLARIAALPNGDLDPTPTEISNSSQARQILYAQMVNPRRRSGTVNRTPFMVALDEAGYAGMYDIYDVQGFGNTNNHLGSRATISQVQGYTLIIQDTGARRTGTLPDGIDLDTEKVDQAAWYQLYLNNGAASPHQRAALWLLGENLVEEKGSNALLSGECATALAAASSATSYASVVGASAFTFQPSGTTHDFTPDVFTLVGCSTGGDPDEISAIGSGVVTHRYGSAAGPGSVVMNANAANKYSTIVSSFAWDDITFTLPPKASPDAPPGVNSNPKDLLSGILAATVTVPPGIPTDSEGDRVPRRTVVYQNVPNPFNPTTRIRFDLAQRGRVQLAIYDVSGRLVRSLVDATLDATEHSATWNGLDDTGRAVPTGVYWYRLSTEDTHVARRMLLMK